MACQLQPECNFLHRFLRYKLPVESSRRGSKSHIYARDPLIQMRPNHTGNQMCTVDQ